MTSFNADQLSLDAHADNFVQAHRIESTDDETFLRQVLYGTMRYSKLLAGVGGMTFPFHDAHGRYLVVAPGAGLDWRVGRSRLQGRVLDVEYQYWPGFTFGPMRNLGVSSGVSWRVW